MYELSEEGREHMGAMEQEAFENMGVYGVIPLAYRVKLAILWGVEDTGEIPKASGASDPLVGGGSLGAYYRDVAERMSRIGYIREV